MCKKTREMSKNLTDHLYRAASVSNVHNVAAPGVGVRSSSFGFFFALQGRAHTLDLTPLPRGLSPQVSMSSGPSTADLSTSTFAWHS